MFRPVEKGNRRLQHDVAVRALMCAVARMRRTGGQRLEKTSRTIREHNVFLLFLHNNNIKIISLFYDK
jgi:hypothetical protein